MLQSVGPKSYIEQAESFEPGSYQHNKTLLIVHICCETFLNKIKNISVDPDGENVL